GAGGVRVAAARKPGRQIRIDRMAGLDRGRARIGHEEVAGPEQPANAKTRLDRIVSRGGRVGRVDGVERLHLAVDKAIRSIAARRRQKTGLNAIKALDRARRVGVVGGGVRHPSERANGDTLGTGDKAASTRLNGRARIRACEIARDPDRRAHLDLNLKTRHCRVLSLGLAGLMIHTYIFAMSEKAK